MQRNNLNYCKNMRYYFRLLFYIYLFLFFDLIFVCAEKFLMMITMFSELNCGFFTQEEIKF